MIVRSLTLLGVLMLSSTVIAETFDVWFGTETPRSGESRGIYHASFDSGRGKLGPVTLAAEIQGCGFLALHPDGRTLYSTGAPDTESRGAAGSVTAYRITGKPGQSKLELLGSLDTGDGGAAHVSTSRDGRALFSAQYGSGSTTLYALEGDGSIASRVSVHKHAELAKPAGSGVVPKRQEAPHAHWSGTSPDDRFLFVPDLGMDKVVIYQLDTRTPQMSFHGFGQAIPGGGPRHMKFSPAGDRIYVLNELALSVTVFDYDPQAGTMAAGQTIQTLTDEEKAGEAFNSAAEIRVHPSGQFVYSSNRGHDSVTVFAVADDGGLSRVEVEPIRAAFPRNFNLDPTGQWLIAAGANSSNVTVFAIDPQTGKLTFDQHSVPVPRPICVLFGQ